MQRPMKSIIQQVEKKAEKKLAEKNSYKKRVKDALERTSRKVAYRIFGNSQIIVQKYRQNSHFGYDELGRDVEDGLQQYIGLLRTRKIRLHTVIVLGSRAKGPWKPTSDVDVTIIASNLPRSGTNFLTKRLFGLRRKLLLSDRPLYLGVQTSGCCSKDEFLERLAAFDIQVLDAIFYGQIIYDDGFWQTVKTRYWEMERKYQLNSLSLKRLLRKV
jgi:predicted nucleotidyltransferase